MLDLSLLSVDPAGKPTGKNQKIALDLKPRTHQLVAATGFRVLSETEVPPGRWQFRVAGRSQNSGSAGSVFYDLDVPDFDKQDLVLSGLVLTSSTAGLVPTAGSSPLVKEVLPGPPTAQRSFYPFDTLALFMEIYDREKTAHTLDVATTLTAGDGNVAYRVNDERNTASTAAASSGKGFTIVHTAQVPAEGHSARHLHLARGGDVASREEAAQGRPRAAHPGDARAAGLVRPGTRVAVSVSLSVSVRLAIRVSSRQCRSAPVSTPAPPPSARA